MYHIKGKKKHELTEAEKQDLFNKVRNHKLEDNSPDTSVALENEISKSNEKSEVVEILKEALN